VLDVLDWIDSVVPSIDLPDGPRELLVAIDGGVQELDAAVTGLSQAGSTSRWADRRGRDDRPDR
jgi:hypothetical protein